AQHHAALVGLGLGDVVGESAGPLVARPVPHDVRHLDGLLVVHCHVAGEPGVRGAGGRHHVRALVPGDRVGERARADERQRRRRGDGAGLPHCPIPPVQAAPGSGVCAPCTNFSKNASTSGSSAPVTLRWWPHADSMIGSFWSSTGLISVYGVFLTFAASAFTSASSAAEL